MNCVKKRVKASFADAVKIGFCPTIWQGMCEKSHRFGEEEMEMWPKSVHHTWSKSPVYMLFPNRKRNCIFKFHCCV
jgi:hypothetical protein